MSFTLEAGATGKAFGSVTAKDIHDRIAADLKLTDLPKHAVVLEKAIKESGDHTVAVKLHPDVTANLKIEVKINAPSIVESSEAAPERKYRRKVTTEG
jgi:large subunit ribosomal protein L9